MSRCIWKLKLNQTKQGGLKLKAFLLWGYLLVYQVSFTLWFSYDSVRTVVVLLKAVVSVRAVTNFS